MASIVLHVRGTTNPSTLYCRFSNGRKVRITTKTDICVNPAYWDNEKGNFRKLKEIKDRSIKSARYEKLKSHIFDTYNNDFSLGEIIDKDWLQSTINDFFNRPKQESKEKIKSHFVYYANFLNWWMENKAGTWKTAKNKFLDHKAKKQYGSFIELWTKFAGNKKYKVSDVDSLLISKFVDWMQDSKYSSSTIKRHVGRLKFFLNRASTMEIKTASDYMERTFVQKEEEIIKPYLTESEINAIFELNLSKRPVLDACRDYLIISCYTALRISDFMNNLNLENISDGYIEIKTRKTGTFVKIPIHPKVKSILDKRFGNLPQKVRENDYNSNIKTICRLAKIDSQIFGKKFDSKKGRGVNGYYKKYDLVTSHIGRRTLASLLAGKVPDKLIAAVAGWADTDMVDFYNKTTKTDYANMLAAYWGEQ